MIYLALALRRIGLEQNRLRIVPPRLRPLQVSLGETALLELCREAAIRDDALTVYLLPYVSFRAAKQHLPTLTMFAPKWEPLSDADLTADLGAALDGWRKAQKRRDAREARRWLLLAGAYLRIAGLPEGERLWASESNGLSAPELEVAVSAVAP